MNGPITLIRSNKITSYQHVNTIYQWIEGKAYLFADEIKANNINGVILTYNNPPVHQIGNPAIDAYFEAIKIIRQRQNDLGFLIMYSANDPIHAGGDLKESLSKLDKTIDDKNRLLASGASDAEINALYSWGDERLHKAFELYRQIRILAKSIRIVSVCGGGTRYGGSAEMVLMADFIVGDSRSALCFSEALIGLIPGWGGIGRTITKAGVLNAKYLASTATECKAQDLKNIGIFNLVVDVPLPLPRMKKTDNSDNDKLKYIEALQQNNDQTGLMLLPKALELATCSQNNIPPLSKSIFTAEEKLRDEIIRRSNPNNYSELWGKPLSQVKEQISKIGRPLAPQSIMALETLFSGYHTANYNEDAFIKREMELDAQLYRNRKFRNGIIATLEQKVADFR